MLDDLDKKSFDKWINTFFSAQFENDLITRLELVETSGTLASETESFSIVFRSDDQRVYPQKIYTLEHNALGTFDLFLVPIRRDKQGVCYEAVFNRLLKKVSNQGGEEDG